MMYYTYVSQSKKDKRLYYGYTHDLVGRFEQYQKGNVISTRDRFDQGCSIVSKALYATHLHYYADL